jgi:hypothetical protein
VAGGPGGGRPRPSVRGIGGHRECGKNAHRSRRQTVENVDPIVCSMNALSVFTMRISDVFATEHLHRRMRTHGHHRSQCATGLSPLKPRASRAPHARATGLTGLRPAAISILMRWPSPRMLAALVVSSARHLFDKHAGSLHLEARA